MTDRERILDRLRKLCALESSPNRHEADAARGLADRLCEMHGVTRAEAAASEASGTYELPLGARGWDETWRFALVTAAARYHGAEAVALIVGERRKVRLVGERGDVEAAGALYERLARVVRELELRLAESDAVGYFIDLADRYGAREAADAFRQGVVAGIVVRLAAGAGEVPPSGGEVPRSQPADDARPPCPAQSPGTSLISRTSLARVERRGDRAGRARKKYAPGRSTRRLDDVMAYEIFELGRDVALSSVRVGPSGEVTVVPARGTKS